MNKFADLRIGVRLGMAFAVVLAVMLAIVAAARLGLDAIRDDIDLVTKDRYAKIKLVTDINDGLNQQARQARNLLLLDLPEESMQELTQIAASRTAVGERYRQLETSITSDEGRALLSATLTQRTAYTAALDAFEARVRAADMAAAKDLLLDELRPRQLDYMKSLAALSALQERLMDESSAQASARVEQISMLMFVAAAVGALLAAAAGVLVTRSITRPIGGVVGSLQAVAQGDLTVQAVVNRGDEIGVLQRALAGTLDSLRRVVSEVRTGADSVTTASSQIAAGNQDLSSRTEQQASSLQETASSMEQLTSTVRQGADNAQQASQLAISASEAASRGGETVGRVVGTMDEISASSRKIADIIGVIDGIAFQTNILALNAAVEAARAGEQGRGFAVVAGEVRTLAQRSAGAAREIKALIGTSVDRVEAGTRQVADAGQAMQDIVQQVRKVADLIGEIASSMNEQSAGIGQVNQAVSQMDQVTQQNAALVEESAAAAGSLEQQARKLAAAVAVFRLSAQADATAPAPQASRPAAARATTPTTTTTPRPAAKAVPSTPATSPRAAAPAPTAPAPAPARREAVAAGADDDWETF